MVFTLLPTILTVHAAGTVTRVTIDRKNTTIKTGTVLPLYATVEVESGASAAVTWSVSNHSSSDTKIVDYTANEGRLEVGADETASTLKVTATSTQDNTKSDSVDVTVTNPAVVVTPSVTSVTIDPKTATVEKGQTKQFTADVQAEGGAATTVIWSVSSNNSSNTKISADGLLIVSADETSNTIKVSVMSTENHMKSDAADVTVPGAVVITPRVKSVTVDPGTVTVEKGKTQQFTANVEVENGASTAVTWSISENTSRNTQISNTGLLTVGEDETASVLKVTVISVFDKTKGTAADVTVAGNSKPIDPVYTVPTNLNATYGDKLGDVELPNGWEWESTGLVGNAGIRTHKAKFILNDGEFYNIVTGIELKINVAKKKINITANNKSKKYGKKDPALTYTVSPALVEGDKLTGSLKYAGNSVGKHDIIEKTKFVHSNYIITFIKGTMTIKTAGKTEKPNAKNVPRNKTVRKNTKITLKAPTGTVLCYTTNGKKPTTKTKTTVKAGSSVKIKIIKKTTVRVIAVKEGYKQSFEVKRIYKTR
jgi:hypothetical protein